MVYNTVLSIVQLPEDVEDVTQEVCSGYQSIEGFGKSKFSIRYIALPLQGHGP
jgi:hypothetical protein